VTLAGYTAADTPDPRVSLLRRPPRLANLSPFCGLHPAVRCLRDEGDRTRRPDMVGYSRLMEVVETGLTSESDSDRTSAGLLPAPLVSR
jgi:hypothetical protein